VVRFEVTPALGELQNLYLERTEGDWVKRGVIVDVGQPQAGQRRLC
jgi:hypothetical protein